MSHIPCVRCGHVLQTDGERVVVAMTVDEMAELAAATNNAGLRWRLACAIGLLDAARERAVLSAAAAAFRDQETQPALKEAL